MKKLSFLLPLVMSAGFAFFNPALAAVPLVDGRGTAAITQCPAQSDVAQVFHSDKIVFIIEGPLRAAIATDQEALDRLPRKVELDIKVRDNPARVANLKSKVLSFLGASIDPAIQNDSNITITDVEYTAVVCPK